jgi:hypothetical protein
MDRRAFLQAGWERERFEGDTAMRAITKLLAGSVAVAAFACAAPAAAQYYPGYPGYGYGYPYGGNVVGQVVNNVLGGGYGMNSQAVVNMCANAVQGRLSGYSGYGGYAYGGGRVLGISRVEQRGTGGLRVRGVATSGRYGGYGNQTPDLVWKCSVDYRGAIIGLDVNRAYGTYGSNYTPWNYDYSQYGYRRY